MPRPKAPIAARVDPITRAALTAADAADMPANQVAAVCGVSPHTVSRWRSGELSPTGATLAPLLAHLKIRRLPIAA